jgi:hypothetical protein
MASASTNDTKHWKVNRTVELGASRDDVWQVIGGFYTIHLWHPDIRMIEIPHEQTTTRELRRILTFPDQPKTTEELLSLDNDDCCYHYKWYAGAWGEDVQHYRAALRVFAGDLNRTSIVQWSSEFDYPTDAISTFYENGFRALRDRFPLKTTE